MVPRLRIQAMLASVFIALVCSVTLFAGTGYVAPGGGADRPLQAAFIRAGDLWIKQGDRETQATMNHQASKPKWSHDGNLVAYSGGKDNDEIWVYAVQTKRNMLVYAGGHNYQWAPDRNTLAFQIGGVLNVADVTLEQVKPFRNVTLGVGNYAWEPGGKSFLVSSGSQLLPTGWTPVKLFIVPLNANMETDKAKLFFTLPEMTKDFFAVGTSTFKWSRDGKWIAFIGVPTASWSADSNTLCVLSADGRTFKTLDKMLHYENWFQWAPSRDLLAYIEGEGRFAVEDKHLKVKELPSVTSLSFTPKGYVDRDFTWMNDEVIVVSRAVESKWTNDPAKRPLPVMYRVDISGESQRQLTSPPAGFGDFSPSFQHRTKQLAWIRSDRKIADAWIADADGGNPKPYIHHLGETSAYYDYWSFDSVIAWY